MALALLGGTARRPDRDVVALRPLIRLDADEIRQWRRLADRAAEPNPYAGPDMALAAAAQLSGGAEAALLSVRRDGAMTFALPVARYHAHPRVPVPILGAWQRPYPPLATPLLDAEHGVAAWRAIRAALGTRLRAAWLLIDPMTADGPVARALHATSETSGGGALGPRSTHTWQRGAVFRDRGPAEPSGRTRRNLARRRRNLAALLGTEPQVGFWSGANQPPTELTDRFLALEAAGWKGRAGTALADDPGAAAFFRDMLDRHRADDALEIVTLHAGRRLIAATVNLRAGDGVFCHKTAYDERFHACTPGRLLVQDSIRLFFENTDCRVMDSCASADSQIANQMFTDRIDMASMIIPGTTAASQVAARAFLTARTARAGLSRRLHR